MQYVWADALFELDRERREETEKEDLELMIRGR